jgi:hypothetical protein
VVYLVISVVSKTGFEIFLSHLVFLETCTWKFPDISYFSDLGKTRCARKIPKPVLETTLISKETTYILDFRKYFVESFWIHSIRTFSVLFIENYLKNLTCWEKTKYGIVISVVYPCTHNVCT